MLFRHLGSPDAQQQTLWQELGEGAPTLVAFAQLAAAALQRDSDADAEPLIPEAEAILVAAAPRGMMDIRANREPFDSSERLLAVCVEIAENRRLLFLRRDQPEQTVRFLEGFRQLCRQGWVMHHLQREFSLSARGFERARELDPDRFQELLAFAVELEH